MARLPVNILTVVGARPQFVKAAVVSRAVAKANDRSRGSVREVIVHTGQHFDSNMSDVFFDEMRIPRPDHHLGIGGGSHGAMTGRMLESIERIALDVRPDWLLVYGDTNSTLAGALAAAKLHVPVAHVEAGLRSFNRAMPEEINRVLTDHLATLLFAPTDAAVRNLAREGIAGPGVRRVGDVMFDAAQFYGRFASPSDTVRMLVEGLTSGFHLATVHRAENTDDPARLTGIMGALAELSGRVPVILPLHPRTRRSLAGWHPPPGLHVLEPVGYFDMVWMLQRCRGVLTDSGGLQKEAFFFGRHCLVLRDETEWVELVEQGFNEVVGVDPRRIIERAERLFDGTIANPPPLYGDGHAGEQVLAALLEAR